MIPTMYNLHAFDWVCSKCNVREYQGTSHPCPKCGGKMEKDILWKEKRNPCSQFYRFDNTLHFQYFNEYKKRPQAQGDLAETMSIQGSCFMLTRDKYWELNICDEAFGSWGQQGVEVACKTWLSGGKVIVNKKTWYAHMFRTQGGDFGFPYPNPGIQKARDYSKELFLNNKYEKAIHPFQWLIDKFSPLPDWDKSWGVVYYTNNNLDEGIMKQCQEQIKKGIGQHKLISVSDQKIDFGDNIKVDYGTGAISMFKKILAGLEAVGTDYVFLCEHDVLYHPTHFKFVPQSNDKYYYNQNCWQLRASDGLAVYYDCKRLSQLCADRQLLIKHYKERIRRCELEGFTRRMGFEPGSHGRPERVDDIGSDIWRSEFPNIDIKHDRNFTEARWKPEQFRSQRSCKNWAETLNLSGWGETNKILIK